MPDLLETIAENDAAVLNGWATVFNESAPRISALPEAERGRELLTLAREFTRRASWAVDTAEGWLTELVSRLRYGMGTHKLRALLASGRALCGQCRSVVEIAGDLWRLAGAPGGEALDAIAQRLTAVEAEIASIVRRIDSPPPVIDPVVIERAKANMANGNWLTPEQARAAIRKSS